MKILASTLLLFAVFTMKVQGHGRLLLPPSRSSMWRYKDTDPILEPYKEDIQPNYNDNQLNCGGRYNQINNDGKCGVCGDPYNGVRENEVGGKYALGIITRSYDQGQIIDATAEITAEHKGYFEFRLCPLNDVTPSVTHECLNQHLLQFDNGETKWFLPSDAAAAKGAHILQLKLPDDVTCEQCVLQWRYRTGNSWGTENGQSGLGLGQQEEFYGCSDIAISSNSGLTTVSTSSSLPPSSSSEPTSTTSTSNPSVSSTENPPSTTTASATASHTSKTTTTSTSSSVLSPSSIAPEIDCSTTPIGLPEFRSCDSFYMCAHTFQDPFIYACPDGTVFDREYNVCDHPYLVPPPCGTVGQ